MFFDASSFSEPKITMDHFREWGNSIASSYLNDSVAPTTALVKIASSEELTPDQIKTLAGEVNKIIHAHKYAAAEDKYLAADFPLADAGAAIKQLQAGGEMKVACEMPAPVRVDDDFDPFAVFGVQPDNVGDQIKTAELRHDLKHAQLKTAGLKDKLADKLYLEKSAAADAEVAFIKMARQMVLPESGSAARMKMLGTIDHFTKSAEMRSISRKPLAKLAYTLQKEGLLEPKHAKVALAYFLSKQADCKAPQELISEWLPAKVVNGSHPLYITLKTFHDHSARLDDTRGRASIVDDRLQILGQKVRAL